MTHGERDVVPRGFQNDEHADGTAVFRVGKLSWREACRAIGTAEGASLVAGRSWKALMQEASCSENGVHWRASAG